MARLRHEDEARRYERLVNPPPSHLTAAHAGFQEVNRPRSAVDLGDGSVTLDDAHRQLALVVNFLVSIFGCAYTVWHAAQWWGVTARLLLALATAIVVAIAEVAVYSGFVWRMGEAKKVQGKVREVKEVVNTWVVEGGPKGVDGGGEGGSDAAEDVVVGGEVKEGADAVRRRRKAPP